MPRKIKKSKTPTIVGPTQSQIGRLIIDLLDTTSAGVSSELVTILTNELKLDEDATRNVVTKVRTKFETSKNNGIDQLLKFYK